MNVNLGSSLKQLSLLGITLLMCTSMARAQMVIDMPPLVYPEIPADADATEDGLIADESKNPMDHPIIGSLEECEIGKSVDVHFRLPVIHTSVSMFWANDYMTTPGYCIGGVFIAERTRNEKKSVLENILLKFARHQNFQVKVLSNHTPESAPCNLDDRLFHPIACGLQRLSSVRWMYFQRNGLYDAEDGAEGGYPYPEKLVYDADYESIAKVGGIETCSLLTDSNRVQQNQFVSNPHVLMEARLKVARCLSLKKGQLEPDAKESLVDDLNIEITQVEGRIERLRSKEGESTPFFEESRRLVRLIETIMEVAPENNGILIGLALRRMFRDACLEKDSSSWASDPVLINMARVLMKTGFKIHAVETECIQQIRKETEEQYYRALVLEDQVTSAISAAESLVKLGDSKYLDVIQKYSVDSDEKIARYAKASLNRIQNQSWVE